MEARCEIDSHKLLLTKEEQKKLVALNTNLHEPQASLHSLLALFAELDQFITLLQSRVFRTTKKPSTIDSRILLLKYLLAARKGPSPYSSLVSAYSKLLRISIPDLSDTAITTDDILETNLKLTAMVDEITEAYVTFVESELSARTFTDTFQLRELISITSSIDNSNIAATIDQVIRLQLTDVIKGLRIQRNFNRVQLMLADLDSIILMIEESAKHENLKPRKNEDPTLLLLKFIQLTDHERDGLMKALMSGELSDVSNAYQAFIKNDLRIEREDIRVILSYEESRQQHLLDLINKSNTPSVRLLCEQIERHKLFSAINELRTANSLKSIKDKLLKCDSVVTIIESRVTGTEIKSDPKLGYDLLTRYILLSHEERSALHASLHKLCCIVDFENPDAISVLHEQLDQFNNFKTRKLPAQKHIDSVFQPYLTIKEDKYSVFSAILHKLCKTKNMKLIKEQIKACVELIEKGKDELNLQSISRHYLSIKTTIEFMNDFSRYVRSHPVAIKKTLEKSLQEVASALDELTTLYNACLEKAQLFADEHKKRTGSTAKAPLSSSTPNLSSQDTAKSTTSSSVSAENFNTVHSQISFYDKTIKLDPVLEKMLDWRLKAVYDLLDDDTFLTIYENQVCSIDENDVSAYLKHASEKLKRIKSESEIRVFVAEHKEWRTTNEKSLAAIDATLPLVNTIDKLMLRLEKSTEKKDDEQPLDFSQLHILSDMYSKIKHIHSSRIKAFLPTSNDHINHISSILKLPNQTKRRLKTIQLEKPTPPVERKYKYKPEKLLGINTESLTLASSLLDKKSKAEKVPSLALNDIKTSTTPTLVSPIKRHYEHKRLTAEERRDEMAAHRGISVARLNHSFFPPATKYENKHIETSEEKKSTSESPRLSDEEKKDHKTNEPKSPR